MTVRYWAPEIGEVPIKLLTPTAKMPQYMTEGAAAVDLFIDSITRCHNFDPSMAISILSALLEADHTNYYIIGFGVAMAIPRGWCGRMVPRSSSAKAGMVVHPGLIDSDYRGEIRCVVTSGANVHKHKLQLGDRIAQLFFTPAPQASLRQVDDLPPTARGAGGFGSSGMR